MTFDDLIPRMKQAGFASTALAALITASFGWTLGEGILAKISLAGLLALCTGIVGYSLVAAYHAYRRQMYAVSAAAVVLFVIGVMVEFLSHTGYTASHRDATIQQASHMTELATNAKSSAREAQREVERLEQLVAMRPSRTAAAARAEIEKAKAHKWWTSTESCTATKGPQTRTWCDAFRAAEADLKGWDDLSVNETKLVEAKAALNSARDAAGKVTLGHASGASQGLILASMYTQTETPDRSAVFWAGVGISSLLALFAIAAGGLLNFIAFAFEATISTVTRSQKTAPTIVREEIHHSDPRWNALVGSLKDKGLLAT